jgi:hypothetical protein
VRYLNNIAIFVQNVISADRVSQRNEIYNGIHYSFSGYFNYTLSSFFPTGTTQLNDESACESAGGLF